MNVYGVAPDYIRFDDGRSVKSSTFKTNAAMLGTTVLITPAEAHDPIGSLKRSHANLRTVYDKPRTDAIHIRKEDRLSMGSRVINKASAFHTDIHSRTVVYVVGPTISGCP